jgi:hypothetical protein
MPCIGNPLSILAKNPLDSRHRVEVFSMNVVAANAVGSGVDERHGDPGNSKLKQNHAIML